MPRYRAVTVVLVLLASTGLAGCLMPPPELEGIGFREARFQEVQAMHDWRACRDEGVELDRLAGQAASAARHLAAARVLEGCESRLGGEAAGLAPEERMRAYGLAVQARLKGGDADGARAGLERLRAAFPDRDLYFEDGTSFLDTVGAILAAGAGAPRPDGSANIGAAVDAELRRLARWRRG